MALTSKGRLMAALRREVPDRVPATVHQWQGFHLKQYLGGMDDFTAFREFGLDASITRAPYLWPHDPNWVVTREDLRGSGDTQRFRVHWRTPEGTLSAEWGSNPVTSWRITHPVKRKEDLRLIEKYYPVPGLDRAAVERDYNRLGDDGILRGFVCGEQGGCWQDATMLVGTEELIMLAHDDPAWVHALLQVLLRNKLRFIEESLRGAPYDLIETGGGAASSTVISPRYFQEFCLPYDRQIHAALHREGFPVVYHTCGGMMPILERIVATDCDASETITPPAMGGDARPLELKQRIGKQVALIGGLDQGTVLEKGTRSEITVHVREMFEQYGQSGGYIMSPSDHFFHMTPERLQAYADAARECRY